MSICIVMTDELCLDCRGVGLRDAHGDQQAVEANDLCFLCKGNKYIYADTVDNHSPVSQHVKASSAWHKKKENSPS